LYYGFLGNGIRNENPAVRNAALYALGQYSEYLQPEISEYAGEILPILFEYLDAYCSRVQAGDTKDSPGLDRIFYALEMFSENLEAKLVPFLPELMKRLLHVLAGDLYSTRVKVLCISAIVSASNAAKESIIPFFDEILGHLKKYLTFEHGGDEEAQVFKEMFCYNNYICVLINQYSLHKYFALLTYFITSLDSTKPNHRS